jgi:hypothetical protein
MYGFIICHNPASPNVTESSASKRIEAELARIAAQRQRDAARAEVKAEANPACQNWSFRSSAARTMLSVSMPW